MIIVLIFKQHQLIKKKKKTKKQDKYRVSRDSWKQVLYDASKLEKDWRRKSLSCSRIFYRYLIIIVLLMFYKSDITKVCQAKFCLLLLFSSSRTYWRQVAIVIYNFHLKTITIIVTSLCVICDVLFIHSSLFTITLTWGNLKKKSFKIRFLYF